MIDTDIAATPVDEQPNSGPSILLQKVIEENQGLRMILGTLLQRSNDVLIVRRPDRVRYFESMNTPPRYPKIVIESIKGIRKGPGGVKFSYDTGDLRVTLRWTPRKVQDVAEIMQHHPAAQPEPPAGPPIEELLELLREAGVHPMDVDVESWTVEQKVQAMQWAAAKGLHDQGIEIEVPERPTFLPEPEPIITP